MNTFNGDNGHRVDLFGGIDGQQIILPRLADQFYGVEFAVGVWRILQFLPVQGPAAMPGGPLAAKPLAVIPGGRFDDNAGKLRVLDRRRQSILGSL